MEHWHLSVILIDGGREDVHEGPSHKGPSKSYATLQLGLSLSVLVISTGVDGQV